MAIIEIGFTRCAICDELLAEKDKLVATSHFIANMADPLWRYSDAAMHKACFQMWLHRKKFVAKYNKHHFPKRHMKEDGSIGYPD